MPRKLYRTLAACICLSFQVACGSSGGTGSSGTGGGTGNCNVDADCSCGQVCSWTMIDHTCVAASNGDPGWCDTTSNCLYQGQTCLAPTCMPTWTSASVCNKN